MLYLVNTADGSKSIFNSNIGEQYHSRNGALQESMHVFLKAGLCYFLANTNNQELSILEMGLGTGLNFLLSANHCLERDIKLNYVGIEAFPLSISLIAQTDYGQYVSDQLWKLFLEQYLLTIDNTVQVESDCTLKLAHCTLLEFQAQHQFDIIYFDAFASTKQPEIWSYESIKHICQFLKVEGVFVTYAITGNLKRFLKSLGFYVEKLPGALGKREMLRAIKKS